MAESKVVATVSGLIGDSGAESAAWVLGAEGATRERLVNDDSLIRTALTSREVMGVSRACTIAHNSGFMATAIGLDNRELLPPFLPVGRNQDGVFGALIDGISPAAFVAHLPVAVFHDPQKDRAYLAIPPFRISELIIYMIGTLPKRPKSDFRIYLQQLGREMKEISALRDSDFYQVLFEAVRIVESGRLRHLEKIIMDFPDCPPAWIEQLQQMHQLCAGRLMDPDIHIPSEFRRMGDSDSAQKLTRELVRKAGMLFLAWPEIVEAAKELKARGIRVTKPLSW